MTMPACPRLRPLLRHNVDIKKLLRLKVLKRFSSGFFLVDYFTWTLAETSYPTWTVCNLHKSVVWKHQLMPFPWLLDSLSFSLTTVWWLIPWVLVYMTAYMISCDVVGIQANNSKDSIITFRTFFGVSYTATIREYVVLTELCCHLSGWKTC